MSTRSTSPAGWRLRWSITALAALAITLWASTWVVKVSLKTATLETATVSRVLSQGGGETPSVFLPPTGFVTERAIYRGTFWRIDHPNQPSSQFPAVLRPPRVSVRLVGLSASPFPFVPGAVTSVTSSSLAGWFFAPAGAAAALWASWYIRRRMVPPGHCKACRYDLRDVPSDTCPECGGKGTRVQPSPATN